MNHAMSKGFDSYSHVRQLPGTDWWQLTADLGYYVQDKGLREGLAELVIASHIYGVERPWYYSGGKITVMAGALTDWATIPRKFWPVLAPQDVRRPALVHDVLYETIGEIRSKLSTHWHNYRHFRKIADQVFRESMRYTDPEIARWIQWAAYRAVRAFGGLAIRLENNSKPDPTTIPPL